MSDAGADKARGGGGWGRGLFWLAFFAVMALVAAALWINTESGRRSVQERLEKWLGLSVTIEGAALAWPCDVRIENLESANFAAAGEPGLRATELRIGLRPWGRLAVAVQGGALKLARADDGGWQPGRFSALGELPAGNLAQLSALTAGWRENVELRVTDSALSWLDAEGRELYAADGVRFVLQAVEAPRRLYYYWLTVRALTDAGGARGLDIEREWLASESRDYLELHRSSRRLPDGLKKFWEGGNDER